MSKLHQISQLDGVPVDADVVFMHGLGGHPFDTWRHAKDNSTSWPHWLAREFARVHVWSLEYSASLTQRFRFFRRLLKKFSRESRDIGQTMSLPDRAGQVLDLMEQRGLGPRPILLICHSLGGLLAKQILRKARDSSDKGKQAIFTSVGGVLFLATPHTGALLATQAQKFRKIFGTTASIEDLRAHDAHLRDLYDWYRNQSAAAGIQTVTYFETRDVFGVRIVDETSSHPGVGANPIGLDEDHVSIAKPREPSAQVCGAVRDLLRNHILSGGHGEAASVTASSRTRQIDPLEEAGPEPGPDAAGSRVDFGRGIHVGIVPSWDGLIADQGVSPKTPQELDSYRRELLDAEPQTASEASRAATLAHHLAMALRREDLDDEAASALRRALRFGKLATELDRLVAQLDDVFFGGVHNTLGTIRLKQGRRNDAVEEFRKAIEIDPTNSKAQQNLGSVLMALGSRDEGVTALETAAALEPDSLDAHFLLGQAYQEIGRLDEAARSLARVVEMVPDWDGWRRDSYTFELARVLLEANEPGRALTAFQSAREHFGSHAQVGEAVALRLADRHDDATRVLAEAIDAEPDNANAHGQLGVTYWELGRSDDAIAAMRRAAELSPDHPAWHVNLGLALEAEGRLDEARVPLERAISIDPDNEIAERELARLREERDSAG